MIPCPLTNFLFWFLNQPIGMIQCPEEPGTLTHYESVFTLTLYRNDPWQVELVIIKPGLPPWPGEHCHPNVDSYEVTWYNNVNFTKNGKVVNGPELVVPVELAKGSFALAKCVRLKPTDYHGINNLPEGGSLISVQRWLNGVKPTSVGNDWRGQPTTEAHAELLRQRGNTA